MKIYKLLVATLNLSQTFFWVFFAVAGKWFLSCIADIDPI